MRTLAIKSLAPFLLAFSCCHYRSCPLFCAGFTTFAALRKYGAGADKTVGMKGIGTLGHLAIQYTKAMGSKEIVAINDSDVALEDVIKLGATRCIE